MVCEVKKLVAPLTGGQLAGLRPCSRVKLSMPLLPTALVSHGPGTREEPAPLWDQDSHLLEIQLLLPRWT